MYASTASVFVLAFLVSAIRRAGGFGVATLLLSCVADYCCMCCYAQDRIFSTCAQVGGGMAEDCTVNAPGTHDSSGEPCCVNRYGNPCLTHSLVMKGKVVPVLFMFVDIGLPAFGLLATYLLYR